MNLPETPRDWDVEIAKKIMRWIDIDPRNPAIYWDHDMKGRSPDYGPRTKIPLYSSKLHCAFEVVGEMNRRGFDVEIKTRAEVGGGPWQVIVRVAPSGEFATPRVVNDASNTIEMGIVRNCLKAIELAGPCGFPKDSIGYREWMERYGR